MMWLTTARSAGGGGGGGGGVLLFVDVDVLVAMPLQPINKSERTNATIPRSLYMLWLR
jgi:hypothetical protein